MPLLHGNECTVRALLYNLLDTTQFNQNRKCVIWTLGLFCDSSYCEVTL